MGGCNREGKLTGGPGGACRVFGMVVAHWCAGPAGHASASGPQKHTANARGGLGGRHAGWAGQGDVGAGRAEREEKVFLFICFLYLFPFSTYFPLFELNHKQCSTNLGQCTPKFSTKEICSTCGATLHDTLRVLFTEV